MGDLEGLVKRYIKAGFEYEIFRQRLRKLKVEVSGGEVENLSSSEESGVGVRVLKEGRIGFAYTSSLDEGSVKDVVEKAMEMCELGTQDRGNVFTKEFKNSDTASVFDREGLEVPLEDKVLMTLQLEEMAKKMDSRVKGVRKASLTEGIVEVEFSNSHGVRFGYEGTYYTSFISALAQEGDDSSISWELRGARRLRNLDLEDMVRDAVFKSTSLLNPKPIETRVMPVLFFRESFALLLEAFSSLFLGDSLIKGKTLLKDRVGERVGSELLTLVDDGTLEEGFETTPYDGEGIGRRRNVVLEKGVFRGFLHSLYTATISEQEPTGNSQRGSYKNPPHPGITNLYLEAGGIDFENLISLEEEVFLVLDLMGLHTVDPVSGEFSLGASGILLRNGKQSHSVRGVTVAGNILDLWGKVVAVGNDLKFYGNVGSPSVLVKDVTVGGV